MSSFNRVTLIGNLTRDPELKTTQKGRSLTTLSLAMNRSWTSENGQRQDEVTYVDVTVWGKNAENAARYLAKGRSVLIEGRLQMDSWTDNKTGQKRSKLQVVADQVQYMNTNTAPETSSGQGAQQGRAA